MKLIELVKVIPAFSTIKVISHNATFNGLQQIDVLNWLTDNPNWAKMEVINIGFEIPNTHLVVLK